MKALFLWKTTPEIKKTIVSFVSKIHNIVAKYDDFMY